jgi:hypothetical protein
MLKLIAKMGVKNWSKNGCYKLIKYLKLLIPMVQENLSRRNLSDKYF